MNLDYENFYKWCKENLNLELNAYKQQQLQRRIKTIMKSSGAKDLQEYSKLINENEEIKINFLDYITINVTEFYRNKDIFDEFTEVLIKDVAKDKRKLNIWSAACSIGAEPYTLAMILDKNNNFKNSRILATDLDKNVLEKAKEGSFYKRDMKNIEEEDIVKYFDKKDDIYTVIDKLKKNIDFKQHDLIMDDYEKGFDAIICRNVTIYFKNETKDVIYKKMYDSLNDGGILFTGATENIYNPDKFGFDKLSTFIYQKKIV